MNVDLGIWEKLTRLVLLLLLLAGILGVAIWYFPLIQQNERMRKELLKQHTKIAQQEELGRHLEHSIKALRSDPLTVERIAREKLGYAKPGETIFRFEAPVTNSATRPQP